MKKIIVTIICVLFALSLSSCGEHRHYREKEYTYDNTHHWYKCQDEECSEKLELAPHDWNEGTQTVKPTAEKDGITTYFCRVCFASKEEKVPYVASNKVNKTEWQRAFSKSSLSNLTARLVDTVVIDGVEYNLICNIVGDDTHIYVTNVSYENGYEKSYEAKYQSGNYQWIMTSREQTVEDAHYTFVSGNDVMMMGNILADYNLDMTEYFDSFTYDAVDACYKAENVGDYSSVSVAFSDGKIVEIEAVNALDGGEINIVLSKYGQSVPIPPTKPKEN